MTYINIDKIKLFYTVSGKGPDLIFLHGLNWNSSMHKDLIKILKDRYKVYAIDLPAHGKSSNPKKDLNLSYLAELIRKFIDKQKIINPIFCGHSIGCSIAIKYASKYKTKELILMQPSGLKYFEHAYEIVFNLLFVKPIKVIKRYSIKSVPKLFLGAKVFIWNLFFAKIWKMMNQNIKQDLTIDMKKINCPVKLVWAKQDEIIPYKYASKFQKYLKHSELITVDGTHDWPLFDPNQIKNALK